MKWAKRINKKKTVWDCDVNEGGDDFKKKLTSNLRCSSRILTLKHSEKAQICGENLYRQLTGRKLDLMGLSTHKIEEARSHHEDGMSDFGYSIRNTARNSRQE